LGWIEIVVRGSNVMTDPWDIPAFPKKADTDDSATFAGVGRVLTEWELVEFVLGTIYSIFRGDLTLKLAHEYGALGEVFGRRYPRLKTECDSYFARYPSQSVERQFYKLLERAIGYSGRRNDVAHGFVFAVQETSYFKIRLGQFPPTHTNIWLLVPPAYALEKYMGTVRPPYAYSSTELNALAKNLNELSSDLQAFRDVLHGDKFPTRGIHSPSTSPSSWQNRSRSASPAAVQAPTSRSQLAELGEFMVVGSSPRAIR
jgi:hypothetical protein